MRSHATNNSSSCKVTHSLMSRLTRGEKRSGVIRHPLISTVASAPEYLTCMCGGRWSEWIRNEMPSNLQSSGNRVAFFNHRDQIIP